ncbi:hypothetical protein RRG08_061740 [Elysia crispata]|uniref:Uncharacterized protein n=1 Tax=Elysia crispata TaxID=231223 RepID=A0AAE1A761_9GAST|nr:hypothetical protein RRG08_061740 [Elysia crispata]
MAMARQALCCGINALWESKTLGDVLYFSSVNQLCDSLLDPLLTTKICGITRWPGHNEDLGRQNTEITRDNKSLKHRDRQNTEITSDNKSLEHRDRQNTEITRDNKSLEHRDR